jgi:hypothetical protein
LLGRTLQLAQRLLQLALLEQALGFLQACSSFGRHASSSAAA